MREGAGAIYAQQTYGLDLSKSVLLNLLSSWRSGAALIEYFLTAVLAGAAPKPYRRNPADGDYFRLPSDALIEQLELRGVRIAEPEDLEIWEEGWALR